MNSTDLHDKIENVRKELHRVIRGKADAVDLLLNAVLAGGSVLMDDVPGVGKTTLAKALAKALNADFKRLQFTPDLLPSDILGASVFNPKTAEFIFHKGPVFANIVLADEINRASPRTQSALLEAMNERQVTLEGVLYTLPDPFLVIATENPVEYFGTYPLPEAQLDRFCMKISLGYPDLQAELAMLQDRMNSDPADSVKPCLDCAGLLAARDGIRSVELESSVAEYILAIVRATRKDERIRLGASPRAFLTLAQCARTHAWIRGRNYVTPDDVKPLAGPVLAHRLVLTPQAIHAGLDAASMLNEILKSVRVPA